MPRCLVVPRFGFLVVAVSLLIFLAQAKLRVRIAAIGETGPLGPSAFVVAIFKGLLGSSEIGFGVEAADAISRHHQENTAGAQTSSKAGKKRHSLFADAAQRNALPVEEVPRYPV